MNDILNYEICKYANKYNYKLLLKLRSLNHNFNNKIGKIYFIMIEEGNCAHIDITTIDNIDLDVWYNDQVYFTRFYDALKLIYKLDTKDINYEDPGLFSYFDYYHIIYDKHLFLKLCSYESIVQYVKNLKKYYNDYNFKRIWIKN